MLSRKFLIIGGGSIILIAAVIAIVVTFSLKRTNIAVLDLNQKIFFGNVFHTLSFNESESVINGFIAIQYGEIIALGSMKDYEAWNHPQKEKFIKFDLTESQFLIPGFVDTHIHAPQVPNIGLGLDKPLLDWLDAYTYPMEIEFYDLNFARHVYHKVVQRTLRSGTTAASYYATIHKDSCKILADEVNAQGQRAYVGKVSMNQNSPENYTESLEQSIIDNEEVIQYIKALNNELIEAIITPRFAISCSMDFMIKLAELAKRYDLPIQSHIAENLDEMVLNLEVFPGFNNSAEVYDAAGILTNKCIMAHGIHLSDEEVKLFAERGTSVSHCPNSNTNLRSGLCDVKRLISGGVKVGLGSDISGGNKIGILDAIRGALDVSHHLNFIKKQNMVGTGKVPETEDNLNYEPLDYKQALFLATLGGAQVMSLDHKIGNFKVGKEFDALLIETYAGDVDKFELPKVLTENLSAEEKFQQLLQKFIYVGDERNIKSVFVNGRKVIQK